MFLSLLSHKTGLVLIFLSSEKNSLRLLTSESGKKLNNAMPLTEATLVSSHESLVYRNAEIVSRRGFVTTERMMFEIKPRILHTTLLQNRKRMVSVYRHSRINVTYIQLRQNKTRLFGLKILVEFSCIMLLPQFIKIDNVIFD